MLLSGVGARGAAQHAAGHGAAPTARGILAHKVNRGAVEKYDIVASFGARPCYLKSKRQLLILFKPLLLVTRKVFLKGTCFLPFFNR